MLKDSKHICPFGFENCTDPVCHRIADDADLNMQFLTDNGCITDGRIQHPVSSKPVT